MKAASKKTRRPKALHESGSAFFYILLAVILFAALSYIVSRGMRGTATNSMTDRKAEIAATDILDNAQTYGRAVDKLRRNRCSENSISFVNNIISGYTHTPASANNCQIYDPSGGKISYKAPLDHWLDIAQSEQINYGEWFFTGTATVKDAGTQPALIMILPYVKRSLCLAINEALDIPDNAGEPPQDLAIAYDPSTKFVGAFPGTYEIRDTAGAQVLDGHATGCFEGGGTPARGTYHFYSVLIER